VAGRSLILVLSVLLAACSPLGALNSILPKGDYELRQDLAYGPLPAQKLDIYVPVERKDGGNRAVLVFLHGGAWNTGSKNEYRFVGDQFARRGIVTVIPDFRLYPQVQFPVFLQDAALVLRWVMDHLQELDANPGQVYLAGHSSGAHMAMMLAFDQQWLAQQGLDHRKLAGVIGLAGPYDFLPLTEPLVQKVFASANPLELSQPVHFVEPGLPRVLLAVGLKDNRVKPRNSASLAEKLRRAGDPVQLLTYPDTGHAGILLSLSRPLQNLTDVADRMAVFILDRAAEPASRPSQPEK